MTTDEMRARKLELGYTNEMISSRSGVPLSTVQKIFSGTTAHPRYETLRALERALTEDATQQAAPVCDAAAPAAPADGSAPQPWGQAGTAAVSGAGAGYRKIAASDDGRTGVLREEEAVYHVDARRQGEYTLEDYYALPNDVRAELIDGQIFIMESPTSVHQVILTELVGELRSYIRSQGGQCISLAAPLDVQLDCDDRTMLEPDVLVICDRSKIIRRCIYGAPDLVIEILSPSTRRKDMYLKLAKYRNAGVREYWMVDPDRRKILVYDFGHEDTVSIYGFEDSIPVGIFEGNCVINFREISEYIAFLY